MAEDKPYNSIFIELLNSSQRKRAYHYLSRNRPNVFKYMVQYKDILMRDHIMIKYLGLEFIDALPPYVENENQYKVGTWKPDVKTPPSVGKLKKRGSADSD
jgi:hypothetical protein